MSRIRISATPDGERMSQRSLARSHRPHSRGTRGLRPIWTQKSITPRGWRANARAWPLRLDAPRQDSNLSEPGRASGVAGSIAAGAWDAPRQDSNLSEPGRASGVAGSIAAGAWDAPGRIRTSASPDGRAVSQV